MADSDNLLIPTPTIELSGTTYPLSYRRGDILNAKSKLRRTRPDDFEDILADPDLFVDLLLYMGLQRENPSITFQQAQDMITLKNQLYVASTVNAAFGAFNPDSKITEEPTEGAEVRSGSGPLAPTTTGGSEPGPSVDTTSA